MTSPSAGKKIFVGKITGARWSDPFAPTYFMVDPSRFLNSVSPPLLA